MPSYTMFNIKMHRESTSIPWGFRMQGGIDHGSPLQIQKVNPNSLAERFGMQANDYIVRIGQISMEYLDHQNAQELMKRHSNLLELILQRGAPPTSADYNSRMNFSPQSNHFPQPSAGNPQATFNNQIVVNQSYNTPIGLYSADNVTDTITRTLRGMNMASNIQIEEPKHFNQFKPTEVKSMPKPASVASPSYDYSQQPHPTPYAAPVQPKPTGAGKPLFNVNKSGNRTNQKGGKGSALLTQTDNTNQIAVCYACGINIRGPFISAIGHCYCVNHFTCSHCSVDLVDCGFVEENGQLYCEKDFEQLLAPHCAKCSQTILKECVHALDKSWHPDCFLCTACKKPIGKGSFHVEEGQPYCIDDYRRMFQAKCTGCEFPIEAGDRYLEAMGGIYHAECFNCSTCQVSLDGQGFVVKNNRPYCRQHAPRQTLTAFQ